MPLRFRSSFLLLALLTALTPLRAASGPAGDSSPAAEAKRLYDHANDYVANIGEGGYSYAYIQFYWKRAQTSIDRVLRVYPDTPAGKALKSGQFKVGPYEVAYFRDRVLPRLEEKRIASVDAINCAIFLCELKGETWDDARHAGIAGVLEDLSRQKRWGEALKFPVLPTEADRILKLSVIFRVAARYDQDDIVKQLLAASPNDLPLLHAIQGEALALRGAPRTAVAALLDADSAESVKLAILGGMIERETQIRRKAALRLPVSPEGIDTTHYTLKKLDVRDDVESVARTFFPGGNAAAGELLAQYHAALGEKPAASAPLVAHLAYLDYLAAFEKFDELERYPAQANLSAAARPAAELKLVQLYAEAGRTAESERHRLVLAGQGDRQADAAALAQFRGEMNRTDVPLVVHEQTLAALPFHDPALLAQAIMEWSLTPTRSIRGAAPYDAVVQKFAPGFANLAAPKSDAVRDAASTQKPF